MQVNASIGKWMTFGDIPSIGILCCIEKDDAGGQYILISKEDCCALA